MSTHQLPMSTLPADALLPADHVKTQLQQLVGRKLGKETLRRWKRAVGAELVVLDGKHFYTEKDAYKVVYIANYLARVEKNLSNAVVQLFEELSNVSN